MKDEQAQAIGRPVLAPVDFSSCCGSAVILASQIARWAETALVVMHAVHEPGEKPGRYRPKNGTNNAQRMEDVALRLLEEFLEGVMERHPEVNVARSKVISGLPVQRILDTVDQENVAMIVMGTHGRTGLSRLALGSVAGQVIERSRVPVTTVTAKVEDWDSPGVHKLGTAAWWELRAPNHRTVSPAE